MKAEDSSMASSVLYQRAVDWSENKTRVLLRVSKPIEIAVSRGGPVQTKKNQPNF